MKIKEIITLLNAKVISEAKDMDYEIKAGCGSDLISDALSFSKAGEIWLTGLTTTQIIYAAEVIGIKVICFVRGKIPNNELVRLAKLKDFVLLSTDCHMFESCGKLYKAGLKGSSEMQ